MPRQSDPSTLFGRRLRAARGRAGIAQDKLGVLIGLDESSSSARMSRYETGVHEPPFSTALNLAEALDVPVAYFYCDDERLAELLIQYGAFDEPRKKKLLAFAADLA
jgi:transcriptional regulator with XRE-family HTH domain